MNHSENDCADCEHAMSGPMGTYCSYFKEEIFDGSVAEDCDEYKEY